VLATQALPAGYADFNERWQAPFGRRAKTHLGRVAEDRTRLARRCGPFAWQPNSTLRRFEYPWVHEQIGRMDGELDIVEIGGGLSGLQWVLARAGHRVVNVDPGMEARGKGWALPAERHAHLSKVFGRVELRSATIAEAGLADDSVDVLLSVSTIEHFAPEDLEEFAAHAARVLRPGGRAILTIDLFLDLHPFTGRRSNRYGTNIDVRLLLERCGLELEHGDRACLNGFPDFSPQRVQADLSDFLVGTYPALSQCLVARRPLTG
jgi:SAM-dependent methyltransferase